MQYVFSPLSGEQQRKAKYLAQALGIPPILAHILYQRGFTEEEPLFEYLHPQLANLPSPMIMKDMAKAVARLIEAWRRGETIHIHGDYDVDGITSTALVHAFLQEAGLASNYYIPNRTKEKYGLSTSSIDTLLAASAPGQGRVLITVDCGISSLAEVDYAREKHGCDVLITDHHQPGASLPAAYAILNPKQPHCDFPFTGLSGVGVAFFFIMALRRGLTEAGCSQAATINLKKHLDLVALGTIADVVPLRGVNRILVRAGLEVLMEKKRLGVAALMRVSGLHGIGALTSEDVAFRLAPRINACGRLGKPLIGVALLLAQQESEARTWAAELEALNDERKALEAKVLDRAVDACEQQRREGRAGLVVYDPLCHPGVLGIIASRMVDRFRRPAIIFTKDQPQRAGNFLKGSGRSVPGVNLHQSLQSCAALIEQFGGHPMAAGLTIAEADLEAFCVQLNQTIANRLHLANQALDFQVDYHFARSTLLNNAFLQALHMMQPCGEGNPDPVFRLSGGEPLRQIKQVREHVLFQVRCNNGQALHGIGFNLASQFADLSSQRCDLIFKLKPSRYRGLDRTQMQVLHFCPE